MPENRQNARQPLWATASHYVPKLIEETLKLRLNLVTGYPGGAEQDLALERGEVQCRAGPCP